MRVVLGKCADAKQAVQNALALVARDVAELGQATGARTVLEPLLADDFANLPGNYSALYGVTLVVWACARIGDAQEEKNRAGNRYHERKKESPKAVA